MRVLIRRNSKANGECPRKTSSCKSKGSADSKAKDIITHFEDRTASIDGKGMIVAMSRHITVDLYNEIVAIRPNWHSKDPTKVLSNLL